MDPRPIRAAAIVWALMGLVHAEGQEQPVPRSKDAYGDTLPEGAVARFGSMRFKHNDLLACLAFSPDGRTLATGTHYDGTPHLWDVNSGTEVRTYTANWQSVERIEFTPDGKYILTGANGNSPALHEVATGRRVRTFTSSARGAGKLVHGGDWVACAEWKHAVCWEAATGREVWRTPIAEDRYWTDFSQDGELVANAGRDGLVKLISGRDGEELGELQTGIDSLRYLAFSHDGRWLAVAGLRGPVQVWDLTGGRILLKVGADSDGVNDVAWSPDDSILAVLDGSRPARLYSLTDGGGATCNVVPEAGAVAFSIDGRLLALASGQRIQLWSLPENRLVFDSPGHDERLFALALSGDGRILAAGGWGDFIVWDAESQRPLKTIPVWWGLTVSAVLDHSGDRLMTSHESVIASMGGGETRLTTWRTDKAVSLGNGSGGGDVAITPDGTRVAGVGGWPSVWDAKTGALVAETSSLGQYTWSVDFCPCTRHIVFGGQLGRSLKQGEGEIAICDATSLKKTEEIRGGVGAIRNVDFSLDEEYLCSASWDGTARVHEVSTGREVLTLRPRSAAWAALLIPGRRMVALACADGGIRIHDSWTGVELATLSGHRAPATALACSRDGRLLYSASIDTTVLGWDIERVPVRPCKGKEPRTSEACWSDMESDSASAAHLAMSELAAGGEEAVGFVARRLGHPAPPGDPAALSPLLERLNADDVAVRQEASNGLEALGRDSLPLVQVALRSSLSEEARERVVSILDVLEPSIGWPDSGEDLRRMRAIRVLEAIGSQAARKTLADVVARPNSLREMQAAERAAARLVR